MVKFELQKLFTNKLLVPTICVVLFTWIFVLLNVYRAKPDYVLIKSLSFWNGLGSLAMVFIILMITTKIFSMDHEEKVEELFNTTKFGKRILFKSRLKAVVIFIFLTYIIFTVIQIGLTFSFVKSEQVIGIQQNMTVVTYLLLQNITVLVGVVIFTIFTAHVCNSFKSHPITLIICGLLFGISYITRTTMVDKYSVHWLLDKGFFSHLIRGRLFNLPPIDYLELLILVFWYNFLLIGIIMVNKRIQIRRYEV